jgi:C-terminal processing protease CtpA/Prc
LAGQDDACPGFSVIDVVSSSPADRAGIRGGDKILAIDGTPVNSLDLTAVRERFRGDPSGRKLRLHVQSGSEVRDAVLRLRDLV